MINPEAKSSESPEHTRQKAKGSIKKIKTYPKQPENEFVKRVNELNLDWIQLKKERVLNI